MPITVTLLDDYKKITALFELGRLSFCIYNAKYKTYNGNYKIAKEN